MHLVDFLFAFKVLLIVLGIAAYVITAVILCAENRSMGKFLVGWLMWAAALIVFIAAAHAGLLR